MFDRIGCSKGWMMVGLVATLGCAESFEESPSEGVVRSSAPVKQVENASRPTPLPRDAVIDWEAAKLHPHLASVSLPVRLHSVLKVSPVPALVPQASPLLSVGTATRGPSWYALSMRLDGHTVFVSGNRTEVFVPGVSDTRTAPLDFDARVSRSRGVVSATFLAFGVAYVLEVTCDRPFDDVRCTEDDYVRSLLADLVVAGGAS